MARTCPLAACLLLLLCAPGPAQGMGGIEPHEAAAAALLADEAPADVDAETDAPPTPTPQPVVGIPHMPSGAFETCSSLLQVGRTGDASLSYQVGFVGQRASLLLRMEADVPLGGRAVWVGVGLRPAASAGGLRRGMAGLETVVADTETLTAYLSQRSEASVAPLAAPEQQQQQQGTGLRSLEANNGRLVVEVVRPFNTSEPASSYSLDVPTPWDISVAAGSGVPYHNWERHTVAAVLTDAFQPSPCLGEGQSRGGGGGDGSGVTVGVVVGCVVGAAGLLLLCVYAQRRAQAYDYGDFINTLREDPEFAREMEEADWDVRRCQV